MRLINNVLRADSTHATQDLKALSLYMQKRFRYGDKPTKENYYSLIDYMARLRNDFIIQPWATDVYYTSAPAGATYPYQNLETYPRVKKDSLWKAVSDSFYRTLSTLPAAYYTSALQFDFNKVAYTVPVDSLTWSYGRTAQAYVYPKTNVLEFEAGNGGECYICLLYTSPSPRD